MKTNKSAKKHKSKILENLLGDISILSSKKNELKMEVSAQIIEHLTNSGMSKSELSELVNKKNSIISKWVSGTHNFTLDTLSEIAHFLGEKPEIRLVNKNLENKS